MDMTRSMGREAAMVERESGSEGGSYLGHVQWRAATQSPPSLVTMFPACRVDEYLQELAITGRRVPAFVQFWHGAWCGCRIASCSRNTGIPRSMLLPELSYERILPHLPLKDIDLQNAGQAVPHFRDWLKHQSYDEYWKSISDEEHFDKVKVPVHTSGGWFDIFLNGTINGFTGVRKHGATEKARRESKMIIGAWGHGASRKFGDVDFGPTANRNMFDRQLRWYDHYLKGEDNGIDREPPIEIFYMGVDKWASRGGLAFAGHQVHAVLFSVRRSFDGREAIRPRAPEKYSYDPKKSGSDARRKQLLRNSDACRTEGPAADRIEERCAWLHERSADESAGDCGPVQMKLFAATDGRDTDWMIKLVDVYPDGFAMNIAEGMLRARFRKGVDKMELLQPNQVYEYDIDMAGTANVFQPGHRIRVDITSSNFPQFDRNPNTGADLGASNVTRIAAQTILMGRRRHRI